MKHFYEFAEFRLNAEDHTLWSEGQLVPIVPKALEILILLVKKRGGIVSREELLEAVWHDTFVEESNITYTVSLLRKTLRENNKGDLVQTIPKRGYRFAAEVREVIDQDTAADVIHLSPSNNESVDVITPDVLSTDLPEKRSRWQLVALMLLGLFFVTSFAYWWGPRSARNSADSSPTQRNIRTIAILPLKTVDESEQGRSLAMGITGSLIDRLGSLDRFSVRPLNAVKGYIENDQDPIKFGERIKADAVFEGTLQMVDDRLRINAKLWDVSDGSQLWHEAFETAESDLFDLQDAISTKVTRSIVAELDEADRLRLTKRYTDNPEAYRAYIRGRAIFDKKNPGNAEKAIDEYQKAVAIDPTFALAYAGFADAFTRIARALPPADSHEAYGRAKAAANKALVLDPELAEAYASLGLINRLYDWDWAGAERNFKSAIELNPNYPNAHLWYGQLLAMVGRTDEALLEIDRAIKIDPLSPDVQAGRLSVLESRGEYAEALKLAREFADFDKGRQLARRGLATFLLHNRDFAQVIEIAEQDLPKYNGQKYVWHSLLASAYHQTGQNEKRDEMLHVLEESSRTDSQALYSLAQNYAEMGRSDEAIEVLLRCFDLREERMAWIKAEPRFNALKQDPRFEKVLRKMNLPS